MAPPPFFPARGLLCGHTIVSQFKAPYSSLPDSVLSFWGSLIMRMAYGTEDEPYIKSLIRNVETYLRAYFDFASPGRLFVTSFPIMQHIPAWFPGAKWKRTLFSYRDMGIASIQTPWDDVKARAVRPSSSCAVLPRFADRVSPSE
jgi:hypothetical protein